MSGSPANAESLPAVQTAHSPELPPALAAVFDTTPQYVNAMRMLLARFFSTGNVI